MRRKYRNKRSERGMSLIEVIVVMVMIGIVAYPLMGLAKVNLANIVAYSRIQKAQFDLQSQMEQVMAEYRVLGYDDLKNNWEGDTGETVSGLYHYSVTFGANQVINSITCSAVTVTLHGSGPGNGMNLMTMISKQ
jgi:prepilin-type N-terminal cleavage/methylation domain-containing protein